MSQLTDFMALTQTKFWKFVDTDGETAKTRFKELWAKVESTPLSRDEAIECLDCLFVYSHARIREFNESLAKVYPTKQFTKLKLDDVEYLWWIDHFTAGISQWSTLNWFSAEKRQKKNGTIGYAGACTHFVQGYHEEPFYIIPLMHGSWNEPRRNKDSISIEHVNAGALHRDPKDNNWHYWANPMPIRLIQELPPVLLDTPYRDVRVMQPFTKDQLLNNIKLKRIVITALGKLDPCRMSQHSDWRQGKTDMGVLWPFEECNKAAFIRDPIFELDFIQSYEDFIDDVGTVWDEKEGWDKHNEIDNPEYGELTPTHDNDPDNDSDEVLDTTEIQQLLANKGYNITIDGIPGPKTREIIKQFQQDWNKKNPRDRIKTDGIPGPQTCGCLKGKKNASQD